MTALAPARRRRRAALLALALAVPLLALTSPAQAASSKACENGGYRLVDLDSQRVLARADERETVTTVPAAGLGSRILVQGRYN